MRSLVLFFLFSFSIAYGQTDLTKYLPKGYSKTGDVDYTTYLQKGLDENRSVLMPDFPILINKEGLNLKSNQTVSFQNNSCLIMKPNHETNYGMLNIINADNVKVNNAYLIGDKDKHLGKNGEWGMGINILSSSNVNIINPKIQKTWGDGIYIGELSKVKRKNIKKKSFTNTNINIKGGNIEDCLRNGISIISGINIIVDGITIKNISTKPPRAAIDIEPNTKSNIIRDIALNNIITKDNFNGIVIMLTNIIDTKMVHIGTITIKNHTDYDSKSSLTISNYADKLSKKAGLQSLKGEIIISKNNYYGTGKIYTHKKTNKYNPTIKFENVNYYKKVNSKYILNKDFNNSLYSSVKNDKKVIYKQ